MGELDPVRASYHPVAADYADLPPPGPAAKRVEVAALGLFADLVRSAGGGEVADLGCGPGRVTAHLAALGLAVRGIDLSPGMVAVARREHPGLQFDVGSMAALDLPDGSLAGAVAWYSLVHTPTEELPPLLTEVARVPRPGGQLLVAFQEGTQSALLSHAYGHAVTLVVHRRTPEEMTELLNRAGLVVHTRTIRHPEGWEKSPQAYLLARKEPVTGA